MLHNEGKAERGGFTEREGGRRRASGLVAGVEVMSEGRQLVLSIEVRVLGYRQGLRNYGIGRSTETAVYGGVEVLLFKQG